MVTSYAVIGASRGIGLEFVLQLVSVCLISGLQLTEVVSQAARPDSLVFAVVRNGATSTHLNTGIKDFTNVHVVDGDVTDYPSLEVCYLFSSYTGQCMLILVENSARLRKSAISLEES